MLTPLAAGMAWGAPACGDTACRVALGAALADCFAGDTDACLRLDLDGLAGTDTGFREHGCDRLGPACDAFLASAAEAWRAEGDGLWWHLRSSACALGHAPSCEIPDDRLAGPQLVPELAAFDDAGRLVVADPWGLAAQDPATGDELGWVALPASPTGLGIVHLVSAPGGLLATVAPPAGARHDARELGIWTSSDGALRWIPGPVCAHGAAGGQVWVVRGRDAHCEDVVAIDRWGEGPSTSSWRWTGPAPRAVDVGPGGTLAVDALGRLQVATARGTEPISTPPLREAWWLGPDRIVAASEEGWVVADRVGGAWRVTDERPGRLRAVAATPDGSRVAVAHEVDGLLRVRLVDPTTLESPGQGLRMGPARRPVRLSLSPDGESLLVVGPNAASVWVHGRPRSPPAWAPPGVATLAALHPWPPAQREVRVVDADGAPVEGAIVEWFELATSEVGAAVTGADGRVHAPVRAWVVAEAGDGRLGATGVGRDATSVEVVVDHRDVQPFQIVDESGRPVAGVPVTGTAAHGRSWSGPDGRGLLWQGGGPRWATG